MIGRMDSFAPAEATAAPQLRDRAIPDRFKWNLTHIFKDWSERGGAYRELEAKIAAVTALQGTLARGPACLLAANNLADDVGQLSYRAWYFAALKHDEDLAHAIVDRILERGRLQRDRRYSSRHHFQADCRPVSCQSCRSRSAWLG